MQSFTTMSFVIEEWTHNFGEKYDRFLKLFPAWAVRTNLPTCKSQQLDSEVSQHL